MVKYRESTIFVDVFCLEHDYARIVKFIGIWILNPLKTSDRQPVALTFSQLNRSVKDAVSATSKKDSRYVLEGAW